jgi:hypothetical protein
MQQVDRAAAEHLLSSFSSPFFRLYDYGFWPQQSRGSDSQAKLAAAKALDSLYGLRGKTPNYHVWICMCVFQLTEGGCEC